MSLIKLAQNNLNQQNQNQKGIAGWTKRHPILASGLALTGGIAAADAGVRAIFNKAQYGGRMKAAIHGLKEGAVYGGILAAVEPTILHGALKKRE